MKKLYKLIIALILLNPAFTFSQTEARTEFEKMYEKIRGYDDSEYKMIIMEIVNYIERYPEYSSAKVYLSQILSAYNEKIKDDDQILSATVKHLNVVSMFNIEVTLLHYYRLNDEEKVRETLAKISSSGTAQSYRLNLLLNVDMNINRELYREMLTALNPYVNFQTEPERYLYYYNSGQLIKLTEIADLERARIPISILGRIDPNLYPDVYKSFFSSSLPHIAAKVVDSISGTAMLSNICKQYQLMGNYEAYNFIRNKQLEGIKEPPDVYNTLKSLNRETEKEQFLYLVNKLYSSINPLDTILANKFYWAISCLELNQTFKAEQFLNHVFIYSLEDKALHYKSELEWWALKGLNPEIINRFLLRVFGPSYKSAENPIAVVVNPEDISPAKSRPSKKESGLGRYHALLIAVQEYKDSLIQDLKNPVADAKRFKRILEERYSFESSDILMLENPGRQEIFNSLTTYAEKLGEDDNLLIFYAGHGTWNDEIRQGYWIPADASLQNKSRWITNTHIRDMVSMIKSRHTLLVTDACFSGAIFKERDVKETNLNRAIEEVYRHASRKAITSGALKEVPDESIFIEKLLKRLEENQDYYLFAENLYYSIRREVISQSSQLPLYGTIISTNDQEKGDFIFVRK